MSDKHIADCMECGVKMAKSDSNLFEPPNGYLCDNCIQERIDEQERIDNE